MTAAHITSALPPAQPSYIFRGHSAAIHSVQIVRQNSRLITGDAEGWVVLWKLESKRPVAVWRAHEATILGTGEWKSDRIITYVESCRSADPRFPAAARILHGSCRIFPSCLSNLLIVTIITYHDPTTPFAVFSPSVF